MKPGPCLDGLQRAGGVHAAADVLHETIERPGEPTMDEERFDAFMRRIDHNLTRRGALAALASGLSGTCLGVDGASARKRHKCKKGRPKCGKTCCPKGTSCADAQTETCCASGTSCSSTCCPVGTVCANAAFNTCCHPGIQACGSKCCQRGTSCADAGTETCCASGTSCGSTCCPIGTQCIDNATKTCA